MHKDDSHQEVIQKFSFIESLSLSKEKSRADHFDNSRQANLPQSDSSLVATAEPSPTIGNNWHPSETDAYRLSLAELVRAASTETASVPVGGNLAAKRNYLGKMLFALACSYCVFVLWWLFGHQGNRLLAVLSGGEQVVLSKSDVQFIDYMERSLAKIDRQRAEVKPGNELVYVPVYTPTPASSQPQIPPAVGPRAITPKAIEIPAPPPLPAPTPITENSAEASQIPTVADKPAVTRTLLGILELGENKSAALIETGGKTRRVEPGEQVSDGLVLESVSNSKATISDRGIIRSISVGETF